MSRTRFQQITRPAEPVDTSSGSSQESNLADRAEDWARVAREAHQECVNDDNAEKDLMLRRNTSGQ